MEPNNKTGQNKIIYLKIKDDKNEIYECVGVLIEENNEFIRVAFNAHNDVVKDDSIFRKKDIVELKNLNEEDLRSG